MRDKIVLDTSYIMEYKDFLKDMAKNYELIFHITVIEELQHIKESNDKEASRKARKSLKAIKSLIESKNVVTISFKKVISQQLENNVGNNYNANDDIILSCAEFEKRYIATNDEPMKLKALLLNVPVFKDNYENHGYTGYKKFTGTTEEFNLYMENLDISQWHPNEYLIIELVDEENKIIEEKELRFDGETFVPLKLSLGNGLKGKNSLQRCAIDLLGNDDIPIVAILGVAGSGKTFLSVQAALNALRIPGKQNKILGVREPVGQGKDIGYLPGEMTDKTKDFFKPFEQQMQNQEFDFYNYEKNGKLEVTIPFYLKGTSYSDTIIIVDEAEDLNESQIKLIGTRLGRNSRVFWAGDYKQSVNNNAKSNPLVRMCEELKDSKLFGCIFLDEDIRSEASKVYAELFNND